MPRGILALDARLRNDACAFQLRIQFVIEALAVAGWNLDHAIVVQRPHHAASALQHGGTGFAALKMVFHLTMQVGRNRAIDVVRKLAQHCVALHVSSVLNCAPASSP